MTRLSAAAAFLLVAACSSSEPADGTGDGSGLAINVSPLTLEGVTDVSYRLTVKAAGVELWTKDVTSVAFGDGRGGLAYVGPCDADPAANPHTVELTILGIQTISGAADFVNPTLGGPIVRTATCAANSDTPVSFDLTIMRSANQGFFDVAVTFDDIFCSAKLDCERPGGAPLELLFNPLTSTRATTFVLAFACTTGDGSPTFMHMDDVVITCGDDVTTLDVAAGPGNIDPPFPGPHPNTTHVVFQAATYRDTETRTSALGGSFETAFWNVAIGINDAALALAGDCRLRARATATTTPLAQGELPIDAVYPYVTWDVLLSDDGARVCGQHPLNGGNGVGTGYTNGRDPVAFDASYAQADDVPTRHAGAGSQRGAGAEPELGDGFGSVLALGDFDGDGLDDLAIASPGEDLGDGAVSTYAGTPSGLAPYGATRSATNLGALPLPARGFGSALATADFVGDGFDDLVIGAPGHAGGGAVWVVPGGASGLAWGEATLHTRASLGCGAASDGDDFGFALAVGDFASSGTPSLAIGMPGAADDTGAICVVAFVAGEARAFTAASFGAAGLAGDRFGATLVAGDLRAPRGDDLVVGSPGGARVDVLFGAESGVMLAGGITLTGPASFGSALAIGDADGDGLMDLVAGAPTANRATIFFGPVAVDGDNHVLDPQVLFPDELASDTGFGAALTVGDLDGDGLGEIVIGEPRANGGSGGGVIVTGSVTRIGACTRFDGADHAVAATGVEQLGYALTTGYTDRDAAADLVIGIPGAAPAYAPGGGQIVVVPGRMHPPCGVCAYQSYVCIEGTCDFDYHTVPTSQFVHTVDGAFTGTDEWSDVTPTPGERGDYYLDYDGEHLSCLSDWHAGTTEMGPGCYGRFTIYTDGGTKQWQVKVFGQGAPQVFLDGLPVDPTAHGITAGYSFGASARHPTPHGQFELRLPAGAGQYGMMFEGPGADGACDVLSPDPVAIVGRCHAGGGLIAARNFDVPWVYGFDGSGIAGGIVSLSGVALSGATGVYVGGRAATIVPSASGLRVRLPDGMGSASSIAVRGAGWSSNTRRMTSGQYSAALNYGRGGLSIDGSASGAEWLGTTPVRTSNAQVYADYFGGALALFFDWDGATPLTNVHLRGWTGGGSCQIGGPAHAGPTDDLTQWDIRINDGVPTVMRDGFVVPDLGAEGIAVAVGSGIELRLPSGSLGFGFVLVAGADLDDTSGAGSALNTIEGVADPESGLYVRAHNDPVLVSMLPLRTGFGASVTLSGVHLGDGVGGAVLVGTTNLPASIVAWSERSITYRVPVNALSGLVRVNYVDGRRSNGLAIEVVCLVGADCPSGVCDAGVCLQASCDDGVTNGLETGTDCGGICPSLCPAGETCTAPEQCVSGVCSGGTCQATCSDGVENQGESDVDCGGPCADCGAGSECNGVGDCASSVCTNNVCVAATCMDGVQNQGETAVDCSGPCAACGPGVTCTAPAQCASGVCTQGTCRAPTCSDGVANQGESDADCGGGVCGLCGTNKICGAASDCASSVCTNNRCQLATCFDGKKNQNESDIDCGGVCGKCATGLQCGVTADCATGACTGGVCVCVPQCTNKVCGPDACGGVCGTCPGTQTCQGSGTVCDFVYTTIPETGSAHTIDGGFTGWNTETRPTIYEWYNVPPSIGAYSNAYFDFDGSRLYVMNDAIFAEQSIDPRCYALFVLYTAGGSERWQVKVYGDDTAQVFKNGMLLAPTAGLAHAHMFSESPLSPDDKHTMYELSLPTTAAGRFGVQLQQPGPDLGCDVLERDPVTFVGDLVLNGGLKVANNTTVPWIVGSNPEKGTVGTVIEIYGVALGVAPGTVTIGGVSAPVHSWQPHAVRVRVPTLTAPSTQNIVVRSAAGVNSNPIAFDVLATTGDHAAVLNAPSMLGHTIDGSVTGSEYGDVVPLTGQNTYAYVDFDGDTLTIANDWFRNTTAAVAPSCYSELLVTTGGGLDQWNIKVFGDQSVTATRNGVSAAGVTGRHAFGASALLATPHSMFEVALPAEPGVFTFQVRAQGTTDPGAGGFTCAGNQLVEATNFQGVLDHNGGSYGIPSVTATLFAITPAKTSPSQAITLIGANLGTGAGTVTFTTSTGTVNTAVVQSWTQNAVTLLPHTSFQTGPVRLTTNGSKVTNSILLTRVCVVGGDCSSGVCSNDECQLPTCSDGVENGTETGVDCGGTVCGKCADGGGCAAPSDCQSGVCTTQTCRAPTCSDAVKNGVETDVDCGGSVTCADCGYAKACLVNADCSSGGCISGVCRPTATSSVSSSPATPSSFEKNVTVTVRISDTGGGAVTQARVALPPGWLVGAVNAAGDVPKVIARLSNGTNVTASLTAGAAGAGEQGGTWYTLTGLNLQAAGATPWAEIEFVKAQAQELTGEARFYVDVNEGSSFARVSPIAVLQIIGAVADGAGDGTVGTNGPVSAGAANVIVTVELTNDLLDYVNTTASEIFAAWAQHGTAAWSLSGTGVNQVLRTPDNTAAPAYFISNDLLFDGTIEVGIGAMTATDDDYIGMVFRWQDTGNYYLLDWKQAAQAGGEGTGRVGLVLRKIRNGDFNGNGVTNSSDAPDDLWATDASRVDVLGYWGTGWADSVMYTLKVVLAGPNIKVYVNDVERMNVTDYTFAGGKYGPYTYSQPETTIKNLRVLRDTITQSTVQLEVPAGWPRPTPGASPAGNLVSSILSPATNTTSVLSVGPTGAGPHGGTMITASPVALYPGQTIRFVYGPVQAPSTPGVQTWWLWTAGLGGVPTPIEASPQFTILP